MRHTSTRPPCSIVRKTKTELVDWVDQHLVTEKAQESIKKRAPWVETVFAEMKAVHGLSRAKLRGRVKVQIQVLFAMALHKIKQLLKLLKEPKRKGSQCCLLSFVISFRRLVFRS